MPDRKPIDMARRRYKLYPAYKDTGLELLGEIPAHWAVTRIKQVSTKIGSGKTPSGGSEVYVDDGTMLIRSQNVHFGGLRLDDVAYIDGETDREMANSHVVEGDVLLNITGASLGRCCAARLHGGAANVNQHVCIIRPRAGGLETSFLANSLAAEPLQAQIFNSEQGISRDALTFEQIGALTVCSPPIDEQTFVAEFLDRETARIDALVAKKERLIELLHEKRTALITRVVTKGLNPNVPMKDSGVEWLGEIPAHWEMSRLKRLWARCDYGVSDSLAGSGEIRVLTMGHIQDGEILVPEDGSLDEVSEDLLLERNDLLFNRTNSRDLVGKVGIFRGSVRDRVSFASYLVRLRAKANVSPEYLNYLLNSEGLLSLARSLALLSVNQANLNPTRYGEIPVPKPSVQEQDLISRQISNVAKELDGLTERIRDAIDHLRELRTALISAAVTGKIDVRGKPRDLPEAP